MEGKDELAALAAKVEAMQLDNAAQLSALQYLIEVLLLNFIVGLPQEERLAFIENLMTVSRRTDHLAATTEIEAVEMSDVAVLTQERIAAIVRGTLNRARTE